MPTPGASMLLANAQAGTHYSLTGCDGERRAAHGGGASTSLIHLRSSATLPPTSQSVGTQSTGCAKVLALSYRGGGGVKLRFGGWGVVRRRGRSGPFSRHLNPRMAPVTGGPYGPTSGGVGAGVGGFRAPQHKNLIFLGYTSWGNCSPNMFVFAPLVNQFLSQD